MAIGVHHVHLKSRDPKNTMQFYVDTLGATLIAEVPGRGYRVNLHGLQLNITSLIADQQREQHYGIEHVAVDTDGNLWCGWGGGEGQDGVAIFNPDGTLIGRILLPERSANLCFGGAKRNRLFIASSKSIYSVYVNARGTTLS